MPCANVPVLIVGGSGVVGSETARTLRRLHPHLPLVIGGRDLAKAEAVASEVGGATATRVDLQNADLGQRSGTAFGAVIVFVKDASLNSMRFAQARGVPYVSLSSGVFEIGPEVAQFIHRPAAAPILLASQWLAGAAVLPTLHLARGYRNVDAIRLGLLLDEQDMGGPAAWADYERITGTGPAALALKTGEFVWIAGDQADATYRSVDGVEVPAKAYSPFDVLSLATATSARSVRVDLAFAESASRRAGQPFSTEIVIEIEGELDGGERTGSRHEIVHPAGQAPLTALGVALAVERLLGLSGGPPPRAGLYLPETLIDPTYYVGRMQEFGARLRHR